MFLFRGEIATLNIIQNLARSRNVKRDGAAVRGCGGEGTRTPARASLRDTATQWGIRPTGFVSCGAAVRGLTALPVMLLACSLYAIDGEHAVPEGEITDAMHIASAAIAGMDVLLTWNCKHLANPHTLPKTRAIVAAAGYACPAVMTPKTFIENTQLEDSHVG